MQLSIWLRKVTFILFVLVFFKGVLFYVHSEFLHSYKQFKSYSTIFCVFMPTFFCTLNVNTGHGFKNDTFLFNMTEQISHNVMYLENCSIEILMTN